MTFEWQICMYSCFGHGGSMAAVYRPYTSGKVSHLYSITYMLTCYKCLYDILSSSWFCPLGANKTCWVPVCQNFKRSSQNPGILETTFISTWDS